MKRIGATRFFAGVLFAVVGWMAIVGVDAGARTDRGRRQNGDSGGRTYVNAGPRYVRLKRVRIMDKTGFVGDLEALRVLIPADWKFEGEVHWYPENKACPDVDNISSVTFRASSPDGKTSFEKLPTEFWVWAENGSSRENDRIKRCTLREPVSPQDYITQRLLPRLRPGARVVSIEPAPTLGRAITALIAHNIVAPIYPGVRQTAKAEGAKVTYEVFLDGQMARESILATVVTVLDQQPEYKSDGGHALQKYDNYYVIHASGGYVARAAKNEEESSAAIFARIFLSVLVNPRWIAGRKDIASRYAHDSQIPDGVVPRVKIPEVPVSRPDEVRQKRTMESKLAHAREYDPTAVWLERFANPKTNENAALNGGFAFAWTNNLEEYILTNDAGFNPVAEFRENWTQLVRVGPDVP